MSPESLAQALDRLDAASRALLDLSLRRGMRVEEIAELLGADVATVERLREDALTTVAGELGLVEPDELDRARAMLAELPAEQWPRARSVSANGTSAHEVPAGAVPAGTADREAEAVGDAQMPAGTDDQEAEAVGEAEVPVGTDEGTPLVEPDLAADPSGEEAQPAAEPAGSHELAADPSGEEAQPAAEPAGSHELAADPSGEEEQPAADEVVEAPDPEPSGQEAETAAERAGGKPTLVAVPDPERSGSITPVERRRSPLRWLGTLILLLAIAAAIVLPLTLGGRGGSKHARPQSRRVASAPAKPSRPPATALPKVPRQTPRLVPLRPVAGAPAHASAAAAVVGPNRMRLEVRGLAQPPSGYYVAWLYNSIVDSVPIAHFASSPISLLVQIPPKPRHFRFLDISLQPGGSTAVHSGESVLRIELARLLRR